MNDMNEVARWIEECDHDIFYNALKDSVRIGYGNDLRCYLKKEPGSLTSRRLQVYLFKHNDAYLFVTNDERRRILKYFEKCGTPKYRAAKHRYDITGKISDYS